jgi:putative tributyrin esterase
MGGYGAFILALNKPDKFGAGIAISGVLDIVTATRNPIHPVFDVDEYFGGLHKLESSYNDLFTQLQSLRKRGKSIPRLYMACGLDDPLYEMNVKFRDHANLNIIPLTYEEGPGGHTSDSFGLIYLPSFGVARSE